MKNVTVESINYWQRLGALMLLMGIEHIWVKSPLATEDAEPVSSDGSASLCQSLSPRFDSSLSLDHCGTVVLKIIQPP